MGMSDALWKCFVSSFNLSNISRRGVVWEDIWPFEPKSFKPVHRKFILWLRSSLLQFRRHCRASLRTLLINIFITTGRWRRRSSLASPSSMLKKNEGMDPRVTDPGTSKTALLLGFQVLAAIFRHEQSGATILGAYRSEQAAP